MNRDSFWSELRATSKHKTISSAPSAADLKFLHRVPRVRLRNFKSKSGTRIIELLVPFGFRSSWPSVPRYITNFENRALAQRLVEQRVELLEVLRHLAGRRCRRGRASGIA